MSDQQIGELVVVAMKCATVIIVSLIFSPVFLGIAALFTNYLKANKEKPKIKAPYLKEQ